MNTFNDQSGHDPNFKRQVGWVPDGSGKGNLPNPKWFEQFMMYLIFMNNEIV